LSLLLLLSQAAAQAPVPWRVCLPDAAFPPYLLNDAKQLGLSERLMRDAGERAGLAVQFSRLPIARCRALVQQGQLDALIAPEAGAALPGLRFPRQSEAVDPARRLVEVRFHWVQRSDAAWRWEAGALKAFPPDGRVGMRQGYLGGVNAVKALGLELEQSAVSAPQVLGMLRHGRVEAVAMMDMELEPALQQVGTAGLRVLSPPFLQERYYAATSQASDAALAEAWWKQIALLRDTGAYRP
jgi:hypothetical protein